MAASIHDAPRIFDRDSKDHPWRGAMEQLDGSSQPTRRVVGKNWRMDHRVSAEREQGMLRSAELAAPAIGDDWWNARAASFRRTLCRPSSPGPDERRSAYLDGENANNRVAPRSLPPHEQLVHVASLNALLHRIGRGGRSGLLRSRFSRALPGAPLPPTPGGLPWPEFCARVEAFARAINELGLGAVQALAGFLSDRLGPTEPPWWAGFARQLAPHLRAEDWTGLCRALGLGHLEAGEWLVVWRYDVATVLDETPEPTCCRPTVVEANDSPWHFPSPPGQRFEITMPLEPAPRGTCHEVLHAPLKHGSAAACAHLLGRIDRPPVEDYDVLAEFRREHRRRLEALGPYAADTAAWLARHPEPR
ncbi:MAG: hypothetical protein AAGN66_12570 [Acidobacteriota bacterium]